MSDVEMERFEDIALFDGIPSEETEIMLRCLQPIRRKYSRQTFIFLDQQNVEMVSMVLKGTVHILKEDYYGNKVLLSYANRGDLFGESFSFQQKTVSQVSFQAATDVDVLLMPLAKLLNTCSNSCPFHQQLVRNLFRQFAEKNAALMDKINIISRLTLRDKILTYLTLMSEKAGSSGFAVTLSRTEMAAYLCINRSAMSRELAKMQEEGLIRIERNWFELL